MLCWSKVRGRSKRIWLEKSQWVKEWIFVVVFGEVCISYLISFQSPEMRERLMNYLSWQKTRGNRDHKTLSFNQNPTLCMANRTNNPIEQTLFVLIRMANVAADLLSLCLWNSGFEDCKSLNCDFMWPYVQSTFWWAKTGVCHKSCCHHREILCSEKWSADTGSWDRRWLWVTVGGEDQKTFTAVLVLGQIRLWLERGKHQSR